MESYGGPRLSWEYAGVFLLRPILAVSFVLSIILLSWFVAWKTVLVHVPLVQEIFGLRKKQVKPKPPSRHRLSRFYNSSAPPKRNSRMEQEERSEGSMQKSYHHSDFLLAYSGPVLAE